MEFIYNDGGRKAAGFKGDTGDCVTRAIAIASGRPYQEVYDLIFKVSGETPRNGVEKKHIKKIMPMLDFEWTATMTIGSGCKVHLKESELPKGRLVCNVSKHMVAVIDGVLHDNHDCQRDGTRCVYGYWKLK